jgi:1-acyl-sn-glycerol-3-phosphate acyltransferase
LDPQSRISYYGPPVQQEIAVKPPSSAPSFFEGIYRWAGNSLIATTHFLAVLVVAPFSRQMAYQISAAWTRRAMAWFGVEVKLRDPNNGNWGPPPYVFVSLNQNSLGEVAVFLQFLPLHRTIINVEYAALPFIGWAFVLLGSIVVVRQWKTQAKRGIERGIRLLKRGENIGISIEGRRSPDGTISPYKKGPVVLAIRAGATIVPMLVHGARWVWPPGSWQVNPGTIELELCDPIRTQGLVYEDRGALAEQLRAIAQEKLGPR